MQSQQRKLLDSAADTKHDLIQCRISSALHPVQDGSWRRSVACLGGHFKTGLKKSRGVLREAGARCVSEHRKRSGAPTRAPLIVGYSPVVAAASASV